MARHIAVLDIGSSKVVCLICKAGNTGALDIHGIGVNEYSGYTVGGHAGNELPDEKDLANAIKRAITIAENESGIALKSISYSIGAPFIKTVVIRSKLISEGKQMRVSSGSAAKLIELSQKNLNYDGYRLIHSSLIRYFADDAEHETLPIGARVYQLAADISHSFVNTDINSMVEKILYDQNIACDYTNSVPLAEAAFLVKESHRNAGALLVDVGYTHTDVSFIKNSGLVGTQVIPIGGKHFASDIAYVLKLPMNVAERLKSRFTFGLDYGDTVENVRLPDGTTLYVKCSEVKEIIEARAEEFCDLVIEAAAQLYASSDNIPVSGHTDNAEGDSYSGHGFLDESVSEPSPVYLTGGGIALMRGSAEFLSNCLGITVDTSMPTMPRYNTQNYASAYAVARFMMFADFADAEFVKHKKGAGFFSRLFK